MMKKYDKLLYNFPFPESILIGTSYKDLQKGEIYFIDDCFEEKDKIYYVLKHEKNSNNKFIIAQKVLTQIDSKFWNVEVPYISLLTKQAVVIIDCNFVPRLHNNPWFQIKIYYNGITESVSWENFVKEYEPINRSIQAPD